MRTYILTALLVLLSINRISSAAEDDIFELETEGSYRIEAGIPVEGAKKVALFIAKRKAVELAGRYLSYNKLIEIYELDRDEIYSLTASEARANILMEKRENVGTASIYRVRVRVQVQASDFIKAEMEDTTLGKKEAKESYREEMEQYIAEKTDPGKDIAKAYRLLRKKKWRIATIYLNHMAKKYPNWDSVYMAKAIIHYIFSEPVFMKKALNKACLLGNKMACDDLKNLKRLRKQDFGLSIIN